MIQPNPFKPIRNPTGTILFRDQVFNEVYILEIKLPTTHSPLGPVYRPPIHGMDPRHAEPLRQDPWQCDLLVNTLQIQATEVRFKHETDFVKARRVS